MTPSYSHLRDLVKAPSAEVAQACFDAEAITHRVRRSDPRTWLVPSWALDFLTRIGLESMEPGTLNKQVADWAAFELFRLVKAGPQAQQAVLLVMEYRWSPTRGAPLNNGLRDLVDSVLGTCAQPEERLCWES